MSTQADVDAAYAAARRRPSRCGASTTPKERQKALLDFADAVEARADEFVRLEGENTGKPHALTASEEIPPMVDELRFFAGAARVLEGRSAGEYMAGPHELGPPRADRRRRPGHPVELPDDDGGLEDRPRPRGRQHRRPQAERHDARDDPAARRDRRRVPARRAPSTSSPATGAPAGSSSSTTRRRSSPSPARSAPACRSPRARAKAVKRVHLELGGKAPVVVFDDADIEAAVEGIAVAGYFNAGQDCTAATRVLAGPGIHDDFVAALAEYARTNAKVGMPDDEDALFGPVNNANQLARVQRLPRAAARPREHRRRWRPDRRAG